MTGNDLIKREKGFVKIPYQHISSLTLDTAAEPAERESSEAAKPTAAEAAEPT